MKKKILSVIIMLVLCLFTLSGCNLFVRNDAKYYSQVVATYGDVTFTMEDLLNYDTVFRNNYTNYNLSTEELYKQMLNDMIDRRIMTDYIVASGYLNYDGMTFDQAYKEDITRDVYDQIRQELSTYEDEVRKELGIEEDEEEGEEEDTNAETVFESEYERDYSADTFTLKFVHEKVEPDLTPAGEFYQIGDDEEFNRAVWTKYIKDLETKASREGKKDLTELGLFNARKDMWYQIMRQQKIIEIFTAKYMSEAVVNLEGATTSYRDNYLNDYKKYNIDTTNSALNEAHRQAYIAAMAESPESVYYHIDDTFVQVQHILLSFDEGITGDGGLIDQWKTSHGYPTDDTTTPTDKQKSELQAYLDSLVSTIITEDGKSVDVLYNTIQTAVMTQSTLYNKADALNDFIYDYSDPNSGSQNASFGYVVPVDEADGDNNLVEQFADGARTLYSQNANGGNMTYVVSEYGVHIIFNLGGVRNIIDPISIKNNGISAQKLWETRIYPLSEKSYFDELANSSFTQPDSSTELNVRLSNAKIEMKEKGIEITTYYYRMESLWK